MGSVAKDGRQESVAWLGRDGSRDSLGVTTRQDPDPEDGLGAHALASAWEDSASEPVVPPSLSFRPAPQGTASPWSLGVEAGHLPQDTCELRSLHMWCLHAVLADLCGGSTGCLLLLVVMNVLVSSRGPADWVLGRWLSRMGCLCLGP